MPIQPVAFEIDDAKSADENIAAFSDVLKSIDADLAVAMEPAMVGMSLGATVSQSDLLNALFDATAPAEPVTGNANPFDPVEDAA